MKLIVGLGNPGKEYEATRHNVGFMVLDRLVGPGEWSKSKFAHALYARREQGTEVTEYLKPLTFMNNSGQSVAYAVSQHGLDPANVLVIHDDLDVPLGEVRIRLGGGTAGHNGAASVAYHLQSSDFWRIRVGIGPHQPELLALRTADTSRFVLSSFHPDERAIAQKVLDMVCSTLETSSKWESTTLSV